MTRQQLSLGRPPEDPRRLRAFPRSKLGPETVLYRVVKKGRGPWWFGSSGAGRFDVPEPDGTCYLATDALSAVLEVIGPDREGGLISAELLGAKRLCELRAPEEHSLADLTARRAARYGMTLEIHGHPDYDLPQAWAKALSQAGARGLLYFARHDPAAGQSVALFGPAGARDWDPGVEHSLENRILTARLWKACRILIVRRPYKNELSVID